MTTFAHIESGVVMDPMAFKDAASYLANFDPGSTKTWNVRQVPDGTVKDSTFQLDQQGDPINIMPPVAAPAPQPSVRPLPPGVQDCYAALSAIAGKIGVQLPPVTGS